jgi:hypothetical protein
MVDRRVTLHQFLIPFLIRGVIRFSNRLVSTLTFKSFEPALPQANLRNAGGIRADLIEVIMRIIASVHRLLCLLRVLLVVAKIGSVFRLTWEWCLSFVLQLTMRDLSTEVLLLSPVKVWHHIVLASLENFFHAS